MADRWTDKWVDNPSQSRQQIPEVGGRCPLQCQAGQVDSGINQKKEGSDNPCNGVELPREEHQLQAEHTGHSK